MGSYLAALFRNKWLALVGGLWMLTGSGLSYNFAIYSSSLKVALGYNQKQINTIGLAKDIGDNVGLVAGLLSAYLPVWCILLLGAAQSFVGYGVLWLAAMGLISKPPLWAVWIATWLGVNGATFFITAGLVTSVRNFPGSRGIVVGLLKGLVGLSGAIYAQLYAAFLAPHQLSFLLLAAAGPTLTALVVLAILNPIPVEKLDTAGEKQERRSFKFMFGTFVGLALFLMAANVAASIGHLSRLELRLIATGMLAILAVPLRVPLRDTWRSLARIPPAETPHMAADGASADAQAIEVSGPPGDRTEPGFPALISSSEQRQQDDGASLVNAGHHGSTGSQVADAGLIDQAPQYGADLEAGERGESPGTILDDSHVQEPLAARWQSIDDKGAVDIEQVAFANMGGVEDITPLLLLGSEEDEEEAGLLSATSSVDNLQAQEEADSFVPIRGWNPSASASDVIEVSPRAPPPSTFHPVATCEHRRQRRQGNRPRRGEEFTLRQGLVKADFWLLALSVLCGAGSGLTAVNNLAQMSQAQGIKDMEVPVALVSIWNFMGRVGGGFVSEYLVRKRGLPRPVVSAGAQALMVVGHLLFAFAVPGSIYVGSLIVASGYGTTLTMMPAISSEIFGLQNFGLFYNSFTCAAPVGSYLFSTLLAGFIYDRETEREHPNTNPHPHIQQLPVQLPPGVLPMHVQQAAGGKFGILTSTGRKYLDFGGNITAAFGVDYAKGSLGPLRLDFAGIKGALGPGDDVGMAGELPKVCHGAHCFKLTFIVMACMCVLGTLANAILAYRTRQVYQRLYGLPTKRKDSHAAGPSNGEAYPNESGR